MSDVKWPRRAVSTPYGTVYEQTVSEGCWKVVKQGSHVDSSPVGTVESHDCGARLLSMGCWTETFDHHSQQPAPVEAFVPVWGPEWEYVDGTGAIHHFKSIGDGCFCVRLVQVSRTAGHQYGGTVGNEYRYQRDGKFLSSGIDSPHDIVSKRPRTPAPVETGGEAVFKEHLVAHMERASETVDAWPKWKQQTPWKDAPAAPAPVETPAPSQPADVPQWCRDAAREFYNGDFHNTAERLAATIARHAGAAPEVAELRERLAAAEEDRKNAVREWNRHCKIINAAWRATGLESHCEIEAMSLAERIENFRQQIAAHEERDKQLTARLSAAEAERDEAREEAKRYCDQYSEAQRQRSMAAKSLEYAELEISRLQNERNDLGDSEIQLRADLARAKADGERMRQALKWYREKIRLAYETTGPMSQRAVQQLIDDAIDGRSGHDVAGRALAALAADASGECAEIETKEGAK